MITFRQKGSFEKLTKYLKATKEAASIKDLDRYGREGVKALSSATPRDTGKTAESWYYEIARESGTVKLSFFNSNIQNGTPIAIILQYGHATENGHWVEGKDYINPAIQPIFKRLEDAMWKEVSGK